MGLIENLNSWIKGKIVGWLEGEINTGYTDRSGNMVARRSYRLGMQRRFLRQSREGFDDNVIGNFLGLALDRAISLLFGNPVEFEWDEEVPEEAIDFIEGIWEANNKPILLHKLAMYGGEDGTVFVKLVPDQEKGWRIIAQDPIFKDIVTDPDDDEKVIQYVKDLLVGSPHTPPDLSESCAARYLLVWDDGLVSRGRLERHQIDRDAD